HVPSPRSSESGSATRPPGLVIIGPTDQPLSRPQGFQSGGPWGYGSCTRRPSQGSAFVRSSHHVRSRAGDQRTPFGADVFAQPAGAAAAGGRGPRPAPVSPLQLQHPPLPSAVPAR